MGATSFWVYGDKLKKFHFSHRRLRIDRFVDSAGKRCAGKRVLNAAQPENIVDLSYSTHEFEKAKDQGDAVNGKRARRNLLR